MDKIQFDKVLGYIEAGKRQGARLMAGGGRSGSKGYFIEPTVFADVKVCSVQIKPCHPLTGVWQDDMKIAQEEIFGPVMSVIKFKDEDEVSSTFDV